MTERRPPGSRPSAGATRGGDARSVVAVLLAAGGGTRFRAGPDGPGRDVGHKLLARLPATDRRPTEAVVRRAIAAVVDAAIGPVVVVTGAADIGPAIADVVEAHDVEVVHNPGWSSGQMGSVRLGIAAAERRGADLVVIGLGDQPGVDAEAWRAVADRGGAPIVVATYGGRRGNPVALDRDVWPLLPTTGDEGARVVMRLHPELVGEVPCTGSPADIDTVEDLRRWQNS